MSFPIVKLGKTNVYLQLQVGPCMNLSHANYERKRPLTTGIVKDNVIAVFTKFDCFI